ncbi:MAG: cytochrome c oxidase assembly protein, partial [Pseudomonadales bacterium]
LVTVQFLANRNSGMGWEFRPVVRSMQVNPGAMNYAEYYARNTGRETMVAQAVPSVTPFHAAEYLHKTECFCFEQQRLEAGEDLAMPIRFIVDAQLPDDVTTLTLSYTLYDVTEQMSGLLSANVAVNVAANLQQPER